MTFSDSRPGNTDFDSEGRHDSRESWCQTRKEKIETGSSKWWKKKIDGWNIKVLTEASECAVNNFLIIISTVVSSSIISLKRVMKLYVLGCVNLCSSIDYNKNENACEKGVQLNPGQKASPRPHFEAGPVLYTQFILMQQHVRLKDIQKWTQQKARQCWNRKKTSRWAMIEFSIQVQADSCLAFQIV